MNSHMPNFFELIAKGAWPPDQAEVWAESSATLLLVSFTIHRPR
jgi:hypothetical protein